MELTHIASLVAYHQDRALAEMDAQIAADPALELAARQGGRSVLLFESSDERAVLQCIDRLQLIAGVVGVHLVYHHAEPTHSLGQETPA